MFTKLTDSDFIWSSLKSSHGSFQFLWLRSGCGSKTRIIGFFIQILQIDMANFLAYILAMKTANIGDLKDNLSKYINFVEQGEVVEICKRNIPIALLVPHHSKRTPNRTKLGCGLGTVRIKGDLTEPLIPEDSWDMLRR